MYLALQTPGENGSPSGKVRVWWQMNEIRNTELLSRRLSGGRVSLLFDQCTNSLAERPS